MPEFHIDANDPTQDGLTYASLDSFTQGYIEAAFFTSTGTGDDAENDLEHASFGELAPEALTAIIADCAKFQADHSALLNLAYGMHGYDESRAGNDYWYTRNGHGTGFWDRDLGEVGDMLANVARYHKINVVRGDDGLIYFE